jgi:hypothetical protein
MFSPAPASTEIIGCLLLLPIYRIPGFSCSCIHINHWLSPAPTHLQNPWFLLRLHPYKSLVVSFSSICKIPGFSCSCIHINHRLSPHPPSTESLVSPAPAHINHWLSPAPPSTESLVSPAPASTKIIGCLLLLHLQNP